MLAHCMFDDDYCASRERDSVNSFSSNIYSAITVIVSGVITSKSISNLIHDCRVSTDIYTTKKHILKGPM